MLGADPKEDFGSVSVLVEWLNPKRTWVVCRLAALARMQAVSREVTGLAGEVTGELPGKLAGRGEGRRAA